MASGWGNSWGASWGGSWGSISSSSAPDPGHYIGGALGGGGTGIDYQVARRHGPNVDKKLKRLIDLAELEMIIRALTGEKASYKMIYETDQIISRFSDVETPEVDDVDLQALAEDQDAVDGLKAIWKRYNEKRGELIDKYRDNPDYEL